MCMLNITVSSWVSFESRRRYAPLPLALAYCCSYQFDVTALFWSIVIDIVIAIIIIIIIIIIRRQTTIIS